jgi:hypothetical protein
VSKEYSRRQTMNQMENAKKILCVVMETGMATITPDWNIYTGEYIEQGKIKNLPDQNPFKLNRLITTKSGVKCPFIILPVNLSGSFDIFKLETERMAHFQVFSILLNGEPDRLED